VGPPKKGELDNGQGDRSGVEESPQRGNKKSARAFRQFSGVTSARSFAESAGHLITRREKPDCIRRDARLDSGERKERGGRPNHSNRVSNYEKDCLSSPKKKL